MLLRRDHPDTQLVRRVGAALLKAADKAEADRKIHFRPTWCRPKEWEFEVVDDSGSSKAPAPCVACGGKVGAPPVAARFWACWARGSRGLWVRGAGWGLSA